MTSIIVSSLAGLITFMGLDYIWLGKIAKNFYLDKLKTHANIVDGTLVPYLPAVPLVYIVGLLGIWVFALSRASSVTNAFLYGSLLGFVLYAFYDFTNIAVFKDYPWSVVIGDIIWGTLLLGVVTAVMYFIKSVMA